MDEEYEVVGPVEPRQLDQILSVRMPHELAVGLRGVAERSGVSVSDLIRAAARQIVAGEPVEASRSRVRGFRCAHLTVTSLPGVLTRTRGGCGCEMVPISA
jgi:hypothetical protein